MKRTKILFYLSTILLLISNRCAFFDINSTHYLLNEPYFDVKFKIY